MNAKLSNEGAAPHSVSPLGAWALSFGCAVGWGAFMMPGNSFLPVAGPLGTVIGIAVGALIMLLVGVNYSYMLRVYPDAGGAFSYVKNSFDFDHGFVAAWFLLLTYVAIIWANATALPLIGRFLLGDTFQFGLHYRISGFDIYLGELMLSIGALVICCLLCLRGRPAVRTQIVMAVILLGGVLVCAVSVFSKLQGGLSSLAPAFAPGRSPFTGVLTIVAMAPWAFVGFESISHSVPEFHFPLKKTLPIMGIALLSGAAAYSLLAVIASSTLPAGFESWPAYIAALGDLDVREGAPTFYAVRTAMGPIGTPVLVLTVLGGVITGLVGNTIAASRLLCSLARDGLMPKKLSELDGNGMPRNAVLLILLVSAFIPLFGRTAVGWIVDVTTVGAAIVYAYTSACALKLARKENDRLVSACGLLGVVISLVFLLYYLIPNLLAVTALSRESYLILALWSVLGLIVFRILLAHDKTRSMGRSTIVWIVMLSLTLFTSLVWMRQSSVVTAREAVNNIHEYYERQRLEHGGAAADPVQPDTDDLYVEQQLEGVNNSLGKNSLIQIFFVVVSVVTLVNIYATIHKREKQVEQEKALAEESSRAKTSFLSNMSHEIRTPLNAIIGLDNIALKEPDLPPRTREQLEKIGASARHLLGLINDILDMSRIESGRMVLKEEEFAFRDFLDQVNVIINGQCQDKGLHYECNIIGQVCDYYIGDSMKLKQVLINILGNAVKFTPEDGRVAFTVEQIARTDEQCTLRFTMKDTGIGMSKEYMPKIFDTFSQEDSGAANRYGSTGLGMAITKNLVEMMKGDILVESEKGVGTTFTVTVALRPSARSFSQEQHARLPKDLRILVVDDDEVALEHARLVLHDIGIEADTASDAPEALNRIRFCWDRGKPYQILMTDMYMPGMDGLALAECVRKFDRGQTSILILTGYSWDDIQEPAKQFGIAGIVSKPLFTDSLLNELHSILLKRGDIAAPAEEPQSAGESEESLEGLRVLMAEDIELNAEILTDLLDMEGISAEHAENGQIAVDMFSQHEPGYYDAILMDVRMPVMDGLRATAAIRALPRPDAKEIPIIAMTANAFDEDVQSSLHAGMDAHLSKPVEPDILYKTLRELVKRKG
ncbi:MAG: amino acid permease [Oscillospiraceae bacterium]|nr:amino acid permease [Oscillospiraceae bacterium]